MRSCRLSKNFAVVLAVSAIWLLIGEVGVYYLYAFKWEWPQLGLTTVALEREFSQQDPHGPPQTLVKGRQYHYQNGDDHYYTSGVESRKTKGAELRVLIMSDTHIMCTFE